MRFPDPFRLFVCIVTLVLPAVLSAAEPPPAPRPNIVFILSDDHGWADFGFQGSEIKTPNIDRLAAAGARLDQFYVQPLCSPSRAALLTGRYPIRYGLQVGVVRPHAQYSVPLEERLLSQALQAAGYRTAIAGKWHLGIPSPDYLPTRRGFDHQYGLYNGNFDYFTHLRDGGLDWHRDDRALREEGYATTLIAREASRLILAQPASQPLFLYVAFNAVHGPYQVPDRYAEPYANLRGQRRIYAGMVTAMDEGVGEIIAALEKKGLRENTLIVFCSDNGGPQPGVITSNGPLRGGKSTLYEGGVRVPALAVWDGRIKPGTRVGALMHMVDWYPTLLRLAGVPLEQPLPLDGRDAWPAIIGRGVGPRSEILHNVTTTGGAIRSGDWKLVVNGHILDGLEGGPPNAAREREKEAAIASPVVELFDVKADPDETTNLASARPEKRDELRSRLAQYAREAAPSRQAPAAPDFKVPAVWGEW